METREIITADVVHRVRYHLEQNSAEIKGKVYPFEWKNPGGGEFWLRMGTKNFRIQLLETGHNGKLLYQVNGRIHQVEVRDEQQQLLHGSGLKKNISPEVIAIYSPMPGKVLNIVAEEGFYVNNGDALITLEAMKMENELRTACSGYIKTIHCQIGDSVDKNQLLISIRTAEPEDISGFSCNRTYK